MLFAILTPVGIILGLLLDDANLKIQAIILAVSGGTFLYISLVEIVAEEFNKSKGRLYRFLAFGVGCGIMILAWYFETLSQIESSGNGEAHDHITANNQVSNVRRLL